MNLIKNPTRLFLKVLTAVFFFGTFANIYFICKPAKYNPTDFNPVSEWDWCVFVFNFLFIAYFFLILKNLPNIYARIYWLALLAIFTSGFAEKYFIRFSSNASQLFSALGCCSICLISILFLYLQRKYGFSLFDGLSYRIIKTIRTKKP